MKEVTFLNFDQVFGDKKVDIIKQYGSKCAISDFAILLGGFVLNNYHVNDRYTLDNRTGMWFTNSFYNNDSVYIVDHRGYKDITSNIKRQCGARPVLLWDDDITLSDNNILIKQQFGEYPQTIAGLMEQFVLEKLYDLNELKETGKKYIVDSPHSNDSNAKFMAKDLIEYEYEGQKYIRFETDNYDLKERVLSDGTIVKSNSVYWVKVEPITWIFDMKNKMALSEKILFSGIQFNNYEKDNDNFINSDMYIYLNQIFLNDIIPRKESNKKLIRVSAFH